MGLFDDLARALDKLLLDDSAAHEQSRNRPLHRVATVNGYNFTERVRKVLAAARDEADRLRHEAVGTEHLLLGILRDDEGVATVVLRNLSIDRAALRLTIEQTIGAGERTSTAPDLPYTSRAKKVLELAMNEARDLNHSYVGTEHLLLGLLREDMGIAAQVLRDFGATTEQARAETLRFLSAEMPASHRETVRRHSSEAAPATHSAAEIVGAWRSEVEAHRMDLETSWVQVHNALDFAERTSLSVRVERRSNDTVWLVLGDGIMFVRVPEIDRPGPEAQ